jgi:hypothetical protein
VADRLMARPVYPQLQKYTCVPAPALRARSGHVIAQYFPGEVPPNVNSVWEQVASLGTLSTQPQASRWGTRSQ